jgi:hypothetical protein
MVVHLSANSRHCVKREKVSGKEEKEVGELKVEAFDGKAGRARSLAPTPLSQSCSSQLLFRTSAMPPSAPTHPPSPSFPQAVVTFDLSNDRLISWTRSAAEGVLGREWTGGEVPDLRLEEVLVGTGGKAGKEGAKELLRELARRSRELQWGESVVLEYYRRDSTGERWKESAEVLVASSSSPSAGEGENDTVYSILFLRPASVPHASAVPPSIAQQGAAPSPTQTTNSTSSPSSSAAPPLPTPPAAPASARPNLSSSYPISSSSAPYSLPPDASAPADPVLSAVDVAKEMARYHNAMGAHRYVLSFFERVECDLLSTLLRPTGSVLHRTNKKLEKLRSLSSMI